MKYFVSTLADCKAIQKRLRDAAGLPRCGETEGPIDWDPPPLQHDDDGEPLPTPGWTTDVVGPPLIHGDLAALAIPDEYASQVSPLVDALPAEFVEQGP